MICQRCNGTGNEPNQGEIGRTLRGLRLSSGLSLREMARRVGLSHSFLSQLETGSRRWRRSVLKRYEQAIKG